MPSHMLCTTDIHIHIPSILLLLLAHKRFTILRVHISQSIPATSRSPRHRVTFPSRFLSAGRTGGLHPPIYIVQRSFLSSRRFVVLDVRQSEWEVRFWKGDYPAMLAEHHRKRFPSISLTREHPILNFIIMLLSSKPPFLQPFLHRLHRLITAKSGKLSRIDQASFFSICSRMQIII